MWPFQQRWKSGDKTCGSACWAQGFKEQFLGEDQPPATHYELGTEGAGFYAEFLTPLIGSEYDRDGEHRVTTRVAGVTSQNLRYVDLLLDSPWTVELSRENGFRLEKPKQVRIAHPTRFMAQKLLIHAKRDRRARAKDILYLHDTIELLGGSLEELGEQWILAKRGLSQNADSPKAPFIPSKQPLIGSFEGHCGAHL